MARPQDWQWSSYNFYTFNKQDSLVKDLIDINPYYLELGDNSQKRQSQYQKNIEGIIKENVLKNIRIQLDEGVFGRQGFIQEMKEKFKIKSLRCRGRPQKK